MRDMTMRLMAYGPVFILVLLYFFFKILKYSEVFFNLRFNKNSIKRLKIVDISRGLEKYYEGI